jgi:hypothetical protein
VRFGFYPYSREPWHWEYNPPTVGEFERYPEMNEEWEETEAYEDEGTGEILENWDMQHCPTCGHAV